MPAVAAFSWGRGVGRGDGGRDRHGRVTVKIVDDRGVEMNRFTVMGVLQT